MGLTGRRGGHNRNAFSGQVSYQEKTLPSLIRLRSISPNTKHVFPLGQTKTDSSATQLFSGRAPGLPSYTRTGFSEAQERESDAEDRPQKPEGAGSEDAEQNCDWSQCRNSAHERNVDPQEPSVSSSFVYNLLDKKVVTLNLRHPARWVCLFVCGSLPHTDS